MPFFKKKPQTSQQKVQKAKMHIFVRIIGCGWLVYIVYQILTTPMEDTGMTVMWRNIIVVFFLCATALILVLTAREVIQNLKSGYYKISAHQDDPEIGGPVGKPMETDEESPQDDVDDDEELTDEPDEEPGEESDDDPDEGNQE